MNFENILKASNRAINIDTGRDLLNRSSKKARRLLSVIVRLLFCAALGYAILFPLFYMLSNAFKPSEQLFDPSIVWLPKSYTLDNIKVVAQAMNFFKSLQMTLGVGIVSALIEVLTCAVVAYGFARFEFRESKLVFALVI